MPTPGVFLIKTFPYRGSDEEWGNGYHFAGTAPTTPADWRSLVDALITIEKPIYTSRTNVVRALCYEDYSPGHDSVYTYHLADFGGVVPGTGSAGGGGVLCPGDDAVWAGWNTGEINSKGKPIWLRKYFHDAIADGTDHDEVFGAQLGALSDYVTAVLASSGDWPGIAGPDGHVPDGGVRWSTNVTTRTLKRRGRRPT